MSFVEFLGSNRVVSRVRTGDNTGKSVSMSKPGLIQVQLCPMDGFYCLETESIRAMICKNGEMSIELTECRSCTRGDYDGDTCAYLEIELEIKCNVCGVHRKPELEHITIVQNNNTDPIIVSVAEGCEMCDHCAIVTMFFTKMVRLYEEVDGEVGAQDVDT
jgi:hypothetical protein